MIEQEAALFYTSGIHFVMDGRQNLVEKGFLESTGINGQG
jgi:hypothetical protein